MTNRVAPGSPDGGQFAADHTRRDEVGQVEVADMTTDTGWDQVEPPMEDGEPGWRPDPEFPDGDYQTMAEAVADGAMDDPRDEDDPDHWDGPADLPTYAGQDVDGRPHF